SEARVSSAPRGGDRPRCRVARRRLTSPAGALPYPYPTLNAASTSSGETVATPLLDRLQPSTFARADFIRAPPIVALRAERPRAIGVDSIAQAVEVKAVRRAVPVFHVDAQPVSGKRIDDG